MNTNSLFSETMLTAGQAASLLSREKRVKIYEKDIVRLYSIHFNHPMEWRPRRFLESKYGTDIADRTYFIDHNDLNELIDNFESIYPRLQTYKHSEEEIVFAFYWVFRGRTRILRVYKGSSSGLPLMSTVCDKYVYKVASKHEGKEYRDGEEPQLSDFVNEAHQLKLVEIMNIFKEDDWYTYRYRRCKAFMGYNKKEFEAAVKRHFERQNVK
jgi:hypothetical protein